jgi:hypothetical protein
LKESKALHGAGEFKQRPGTFLPEIKPRSNETELKVEDFEEQPPEQQEHATLATP